MDWSILTYARDGQQDTYPKSYELFEKLRTSRVDSPNMTMSVFKPLHT